MHFGLRAYLIELGRADVEMKMRMVRISITTSSSISMNPDGAIAGESLRESRRKRIPMIKLTSWEDFSRDGILEKFRPKAVVNP